jgi:Family of unknown function (DUF5985)
MLSFLSGAVMLGCVVAGAFFLKFWRTTRDRLFLMFGLAFFLLATERVVLACLNEGRSGEEHTLVYLFRLAAFALILLAIANKNRQERK